MTLTSQWYMNCSYFNIYLSEMRVDRIRIVTNFFIVMRIDVDSVIEIINVQVSQLTDHLLWCNENSCNSFNRLMRIDADSLDKFFCLNAHVDCESQELIQTRMRIDATIFSFKKNICRGMSGIAISICIAS